MSTPVSTLRRRRILAFTANPCADGEILPVLADFPGHLTGAAALGELIEVAALEAGFGFDEYLQIIVSSRPTSYEARITLGGKKAFNWRADYGKSAPHLWALAQTRVLINKTLHDRGFKAPRLTMAAAVRAVLLRQRAKFGRAKMPDATVRKHAEALRQTVRGIPTPK